MAQRAGRGLIPGPENGVFTGKNTCFGGAEGPAGRGFQQTLKKVKKSVDGYAGPRIMRRLLRERCPSADLNENTAVAEGLVSSRARPV